MSYGYNSSGGVDQSAIARYSGYAYALTILSLLIIVFLVPMLGPDYNEKYQIGALKIAIVFMVTLGLAHGISSGNMKHMVGLPYLKFN